MTLLLLFSSPAGPAAPRYVIGGNRNRVPTAYATSVSPNVMKYDGAWHAAPKNTGSTAVRAFFENRYALPNGGLSATVPPGDTLVPFKLHASVEYLVIATGATGLVPLTFSGSPNVTLNPGDGRWSDEVAKAIPAGAAYRVRTDREHLGTGGANYTQLSNILVSSSTTPGKQDHATSGTDPAVLKSLGGTYPNFSGTTSTYTATLVQLVPDTPGQRSVLLSGDSILRAAGDTKASVPLQQGDWLNGTSPTTDYPNWGNAGWGETSLGIEYPYFNMSVPGRQVVSSAFNEASLGPQLDLLTASPPTHIVLALGVNDLMQGRTPAQVEADLVLAVALFKARWPQAAVLVATVTPVTNTTDAYATTANQTFAGTPPAGGTVAWANFSGPDDTTGRRLLNARIRAGNVAGADGVIDVAASVEDATDPRKWRVDLGQPTVDGVHPQAVLHRQMAAAADLPGVIAPPATSGLLLESGDRTLLEDGSSLLLEG